jgi:hypothetical protein
MEARWGRNDAHIVTLEPEPIRLQEAGMPRPPFNQHPDANEENCGIDEPRRQGRQSCNLLNNISRGPNNPAERGENPAEELKLLLGASEIMFFSKLGDIIGCSAAVAMCAPDRVATL